MSSVTHPDAAVRPIVERPSILDAAELLARLPSAPHPPITAGGAPARAIEITAAYRSCEEITRQHSKSFYFSSQLLPANKRAAVRALYALCRTSDDIVDLPQDDPACALARWVALVRSQQPQANNPVLVAWSDTRQRNAIPQALVDELLAGIAMDLSIHRYASFNDLWLYCYRVASVVGLLAMQIVGHGEGATPYAVKLGVALQLTNILRDIGEDARRGRIYLPEEDLWRFGVSEGDLIAGRIDRRFIALMRYQIRRTNRLYEEAWPGIALLHADSQLAIGAAAEVYRAILGAIEANGYDVFTRRASVPLHRKIQIAWQVRRRLAGHPGTRAPAG